MNKSIIILLMILWVNPAHAAIDNISSCNLVDSPKINYSEGLGIFIDNEIYDKGAVVVKYYNSSFTDLKPSYQTTSLVDKNIMDAGDKFMIFFHLVGQGNVKSNLLSVTFPQNFLDPENTGHSDIYLIDGENNQGYWFNEKPCEHSLDPMGFTTVLPKAIFEEGTPNSVHILGETAYNGRSPIVITAKTDASASPGDRLIKIDFLYSDGKEWYSTREEIPIHIRDWYEMRRNQYLGVFIALLGFAYRERKEINKSLQKLSNKIKSIIR